MGDKDDSDAPPLCRTIKQAGSPSELLSFIEKIERFRLTPKNWQSYLKPEFRVGKLDPLCDAIAAGNMQVVWMSKTRTELFRQAAVLRSQNPSLPLVPPISSDAEADLSITLRHWCTDAEAFGTHRRSGVGERPQTTTATQPLSNEAAITHASAGYHQPAPLSIDQSARERKYKIFLSYAHKDAAWRDELLIMLAPRLRDGTLDLWYDGKIKPSQDWRREIETALHTANVGVLLVSKHFLASDFIGNNELPFLIEASEKAAVRLSWVLVGDCLHEREQFSRIQALHDIGVPLSSLDGHARDRELKRIAQGILDLAR